MPLETVGADYKRANATYRTAQLFAKSASVDVSVSPSIIAPELLMLAYRGGIFPMADARDDPEIFWIEPRLRAVLPLDGFHCSRSLARTLRRERFEVTCNQAFSEVLEACAAPRREIGGEDSGGSWISYRIQASYENLHRLGHAHSIECWQRDKAGRRRLVGGLYGVGFDRVFCGESMFSLQSDASKVAMAWLVAALRMARACLLDCQFLTGHLASLGAVEMPQKAYVSLLQEAQSAPGLGVADGEAVDCVPVGAGFGDDVLTLPEGFAALLALAESEGLASSPGKCISHFLTQTS